MRIRSIKPEFWRSDDITALDWEARLLFVGLWSYVDDNGVGVDRLADIAADLFAADIETDAPETFARVSRGLQSLSERNLVTRYTISKKHWLYITGWPHHQRIDKPNKPRFPLPNGEIAHPSRESRETPAPGTGEQGNRGTGETLVTESSHRQAVDARAIDDDGLDKIRNKTGGTRVHARNVADDILDAATTTVGNPLAYVLRAIRNEPDRFRAKPRNTKDEQCSTHPGNPADNCGGCAADRRAAS